MYITPTKVLAALAVLLACALASAPQAAPEKEKPAPPADGGPTVKIVFTADPLMLCHYYLKTYGESSVKPRGDSGVDFISEATAYSQAAGLISNPRVWRWFEERIAGSANVAELRKAASTLPRALDVADAGTAVNMLLDAMESAVPKYQKTVYATELNGVNRILVGAKKRYYQVEDRISQVLMGKLALKSVVRPVKIFVVLHTGGVNTWGVTEDFYFTVIGSFGQSPMTLLETGIHEATHIVDALQPFRSGSVLARVREEFDSAAQEEVEVFLHGLVAFNAGELVKRFLSRSYTHAGVQAPGIGHTFRPYLSTYEYIWTDHLDGKFTTEGVSKKLVEEFQAVQELKATGTGS